MSTATCFTATPPLPPTPPQVILGAHKTPQEQNSENTQRVQPKQFIFHPKFLTRQNESLRTKDWDVLIMRLDMGR